MASADPLRLCPHGCLVDTSRGHRYCPWHGEEATRSLVGVDVGDSRIDHVISAAGGFGVVYRATNRETKSMVRAIKVMRPPACYRRASVDAFIAEGERMEVDLRGSDEVVQIMGLAREPFPYISMEFVDGKSLSARLAESELAMARKDAGERENDAPEALAPAAARSIVFDVARALAHAHRAGIVHRDLKPDNVLLARGKDRRTGAVTEKAKVVDWGIATGGRADAAGERSSGGDGASAALAPELVAAASSFTPEFAPPEFFTLRERVLAQEIDADELRRALEDPRGDVYQFGLIAYRVLTGTFPFDEAFGYSGEERRTRWRHQHVDVGARSVASAGRAVPRRLARAIDRSLSRDPEKRFRDGGELLRYLTRRVPKSVAALGVSVAVIIALVIAIRHPPDPGLRDPLFEELARGSSLRLERKKLVFDGEDTPRTVPSIWLRSADDERLAALERKGRADITCPGPIRSLEIVRLKHHGNEKSRIELDGDGQLLAGDGLVQVEDRTATLDLALLARSVADERAPPPDLDLFRVRGTYDGTDGSRASFSEYFALAFDAAAPEVSLAEITLVDERGRRPYEGLGEEPLRLFVPFEEGRATPDLELVFRVEDASLPADDPIVVGITGAANASRGIKPEGGELRFALSDLAGGRGPRPTREGAVLDFELDVRDWAGNESQARFELVLDSGPALSLAAGEREPVREPAGIARLDVVLDRETGSADDAPDSQSLYEIFYELRGKAERAPSDPRLAPVDELELESAEVGHVRVHLPRELLLAEPAFDGSLVLFARERTERGDAGGKRWLHLPSGILDTERLVRIGDVSVVADRVPEGGDFRVRAVLDDRGVIDALSLRPEGEETARFLFRASSIESYPKRLRLDVSSRTGAPELLVSDGGVRWRIAGAASTLDERGREIDLAREGIGESAKLVADVTTHWLRRATIATDVVLDSTRPHGFLAVGLEGRASGGAPKSDAEKRTVEAGAIANGVLRVRADPADYLDDVGLILLGSARPVRREGDGDTQTIVIELPAVLPEGIYALPFELRDVFGNRTTDPWTLSLHGEGPRARPPVGVDRDNQEVVVGMTDGAYRFSLAWEDPSGISRASVERAGRPAAIWQTGTNASLPPGVSIRVTSAAPSGAATRIEVALTGDEIPDVPPGEASPPITFRAHDEESESTFTVKLRRQRAEPASRVHWLGLDWIRVDNVADDADPGFWATRTEIPRWFWEWIEDGASGAPMPPAEGTEGWMPATRVEAAEIEKQVANLSPRYAVYLPLESEWRTISRLDRTFDQLEVPDPATGRKAVDPLRRLVVSYDHEDPKIRRRIQTVDRFPSNRAEDEARAEEWFRGLVHLYGNVRELVRADQTPGYAYLALGGSATSRLQSIVDSLRARIGQYPAYQELSFLAGKSTSAPDVGFRLVVYLKDGERENGSEGPRRGDSGFAREALRTPAAELDGR